MPPLPEAPRRNINDPPLCIAGKNGLHQHGRPCKLLVEALGEHVAHDLTTGIIVLDSAEVCELRLVPALQDAANLFWHPPPCQNRRDILLQKEEEEEDLVAKHGLVVLHRGICHEVEAANLQLGVAQVEAVIDRRHGAQLRLKNGPAHEFGCRKEALDAPATICRIRCDPMQHLVHAEITRHAKHLKNRHPWLSEERKRERK